MRRDDLTTEEVRLERLLQTLARDPAAPDPDFLKTLREASTKAFLEAHANRPQPRRVRPSIPTDPAIGHRLLRTMRIAMMSAVALLLVMGSLPPSVFPSRGVELQVAIDNLRRNDSVEIEVQNGELANYLTYWHDNGQENLAFKYPSGKMEVIEGDNSFFINTASNSLHYSPELADLGLDPFKGKLLESLNVNDPEVQSEVLSQRPKQVYFENGNRLYGYQFQTPAKLGNGETLTVDATVDAKTKTLVAMNATVTDGSGNIQFQANADVKGVNRGNLAALNPLSPLNPEFKEAEQIAMIEEVHGNAEVYDFTVPQESGGMGGIGAAFRGNQRWNMVQAFPEGQAGYGRQMTGLGTANGGSQNAEFGAAAQSAAAMNAPTAEASQSQVLTKKTLAANDADSPRDRIAISKAAAKDAAYQAESIATGAKVASNAQASKEATGQRLSSDGQSERSEAPKMRAMKSVVPAEPAPPAAVDQPAQVAAIPSPKALPEPKTDAVPEQKVIEKAAAAKTKAMPAPGPRGALEPRSDKTNQFKTTMAANENKAGDPVSLKQQMTDAKDAPGNGNYEAKKGVPQIQRSEDGVSMLSENAAVDGSSNGTQVNQLDRNGRYRNLGNAPFTLQNGTGEQQSLTFEKLAYSSRQAEVKSELRPGDLLKTGDDPAIVVRAKLANDANLIVGPKSEVLLLKPTEIRLRFGELMLEVPPKDQVDLLGPEPEANLEQTDNNAYGSNAYNYSKNNARRMALQKGPTWRRQVTGRAIFRVEKNQLVEVEQQPEWLERYYASDNANWETLNSAEPKAESTRQLKQQRQRGYEGKEAGRAGKAAATPKAPAAAAPPATKQ